MKSFLTLATLLLGVALCTSAFAGSKPDATRLDCSGAYSESPAASSCTMDSVGVSGTMCKFEFRCRRDGSRAFDARSIINVPVGDAGNLRNCNGIVKVGGC